jgi:hypothetical protein
MKRTTSNLASFNAVSLLDERNNNKAVCGEFRKLAMLWPIPLFETVIYRFLLCS